MTQTEHTSASERQRGEHSESSGGSRSSAEQSSAGRGNGEFDRRTRRALTEPMRVSPIGGGTYEVDSESGHSYLVDLEGGRCTCPDHTYRGERCKHIRRVAIDVSEGRVPPPGQTAVQCEVCGAELFVDENAAGPHLCATHEFDTGDLVYDRNSGDRVLVVAPPTGRADEVSIRHGRTVADHYSNADYPDDDPVVAAVYPQSVRVNDGGPTPGELTVYSFPRARLSKAPVEEPSHPRRDRRNDSGDRRNDAEQRSLDAVR